MAGYDSDALSMKVAGKGANSPNWWSYMSADAATTVRVAGYVSNGDARGMKVGDMVFQSSPAATVCHVYTVKSVTSLGSADLSDGTAIDVTDSD